MWAGREEKQIRDSKDQIRVNGIRDAKSERGSYEMRVNEYRRAKSGEKICNLLLFHP